MIYCICFDDLLSISVKSKQRNGFQYVYDNTNNFEFKEIHRWSDIRILFYRKCAALSITAGRQGTVCRWRGEPTPQSTSPQLSSEFSTSGPIILPIFTPLRSAVGTNDFDKISLCIISWLCLVIIVFTDKRHIKTHLLVFASLIRKLILIPERQEAA
jgi:hypothetical protein